MLTNSNDNNSSEKEVANFLEKISRISEIGELLCVPLVKMQQLDGLEKPSK